MPYPPVFVDEMRMKTSALLLRLAKNKFLAFLAERVYIRAVPNNFLESGVKLMITLEAKQIVGAGSAPNQYFYLTVAVPLQGTLAQIAAAAILRLFYAVGVKTKAQLDLFNFVYLCNFPSDEVNNVLSQPTFTEAVNAELKKPPNLKRGTIPHEFRLGAKLVANLEEFLKIKLVHGQQFTPSVTQNASSYPGADFTNFFQSVGANLTGAGTSLEKGATITTADMQAADIVLVRGSSLNA